MNFGEPLTEAPNYTMMEVSFLPFFLQNGTLLRDWTGSTW